MKRFKQFAMGLSTVVAMMLVVLPASGASAAKLLTLTNEGTPVAVGAPATTGLDIEGCLSFNNGAAKDKAPGTANVMQECSEPGFSETGVITETQLSASGKATIKGKVELSRPGPCVYKFTSFKGGFLVPGEVFVIGQVVGKMNKKLSNPGCEATWHTEFFADLSAEPGSQPFGTEL